MDEQLTKSLRQKAVQLLAQRDHSSFELSQKLLAYVTKSFLKNRQFLSQKLSKQLSQSSQQFTDEIAINDDEYYEEIKAKFTVLITEVVDYCASHGWLNDADYVQKYIEMQARKGSGRYKIVMELKQRGLPMDIIQSTLSTVDIDWIEVAIHQIKKRFKVIDKKDLKQKKQAIQFLLSRGFAQDEIKSAYFSSTELT